jgi:hypothetical protein
MARRVPIKRPDIPTSLSFRFLEAIKVYLYSAAFKRIEDDINDLIYANSKLHGNGQEALVFLGEIYQLPQVHGKITRPINTVHPDLVTPMKAILAYQKKLTTEQTESLGYVRTLLRTTQCYDDIKTLLPEILADYLKDWQWRFASTHPSIGEEAIGTFRQKNQKYYDAIRYRMTANLIGI